MKSVLSFMLAMACGLPGVMADPPAGEVEAANERMPGKSVLAKLEEIVIPKVEMDGVPVEEAWSFASACATEHDPEEKAEPRGISFLLSGAAERAAVGGGSANPKPVEAVPVVTYHGKDVRFWVLLAEIARQGGLDVYVTSVGIVGGAEGVPPFPNGKAKEGEVWRVVRMKRAEEAKRFLDTTTITVVDCDKERVKDLVDFLRICALELDLERAKAKARGVSLAERKLLPPPVSIELAASERELMWRPRITFSMKDSTFTAVLKEMGRQAELDIYLTTDGVLVRPAGAAAFANEVERAARLLGAVYRHEGAGGEK